MSSILIQHSARRLAGNVTVTSFVCISMFGCIEPARPVLDARVQADVVDVADGPDAETPDAETPDAPDLSDTAIVPDDVADVADDAETDAGPETCGSESECDHLTGATACTAWSCVDGQCVLSGAPLAGTACDNGTGVAPGTCDNGGFVPPDACDGQGRCVDRAAGATGTPAVTQLGGDWFFVNTSFGGGDPFSTTRAIIDVDSDANALNIKALQSFGPNYFGGFTNGIVCANSEGLMEARLATGTTAGAITGRHLDGDLAILSTPASDGVALLLRADEGNPTMVHGTYRYLRTSLLFGGTTATTWQGQLTFNNGCLTSGAIATDPDLSASYQFVSDGSRCLEPTTDVSDESSLFQLATGIKFAAPEATTVYPVFYRGAIGPGGDVLLMVKEGVSADPTQRTPEYGMIIMIRKSNESLDSEALVGNWYYSFQGKVASGVTRRDLGTIAWAPDGVVSPSTIRTSDGDGQVTGGSYWLDKLERRVFQRLSMGTSLHQKGYFAPSGRFVVGWNVAEPDATSAIWQADTPKFGSLLLMLKP